MKIRIMEYDQVDPLGVLNLNLLSLNYALTPELVALIRQLDPRPFPFFGLYAVEGGFVVGQVGVYRLPMMTTAGPEDVGGVCAVCTHPAYSGCGVASQLLEDAHRRMRSVDLRFSTLGTTRHSGAHSLYRRLGYEDAYTPLTTFGPREVLPVDTQLRAERAGLKRLYLADELFQKIASGQLGFARRPESFLAMLTTIGEINVEDFWLLWRDDELAGYATTRVLETALLIDYLLIKVGSDTATAVSALAKELPTSFIQVRVDRPSVHDSLRQAGFPEGLPGWGTFMLKPLIPEITVSQGRRLLGIGTERFLTSMLDTS